MSTETKRDTEVIRRESDLDYAQTLGEMFGLIGNLHICAKYAASADLRSRVINAGEEADRMKKEFFERCESRRKELDV